jgi:hypothetical protein
MGYGSLDEFRAFCFSDSGVIDHRWVRKAGRLRCQQTKAYYEKLPMLDDARLDETSTLNTKIADADSRMARGRG